MAQEFNVMQSLFGFAPEDVQRQLQLEQERRALNIASGVTGGLGPAVFQAARAQEAARGTPLFEMQQDPRLIKARIMSNARQAAAPAFQQGGMAGFMTEYANQLEAAGLASEAAQARMFATQKQQEAVESQATVGLRGAQTAQALAAAERQPTPRAPIQVDLGNRIQLRDPVTNQVIEEIQKGLTPEQQRKAAEGAAEEKPGFIGKTGAYRNQFGEVIPGSEMQKQRTGFQAAEDLLNNLNKITATDIRKAEAKIDYTQGEARKAVAGTFFKDVLDAQTKIAASQLLQQIESLPPGSASDADMRAAARAFPGYSDATALLNWVNRTKSTLEQSLARQNEQYGFSRRVRATNPLEFGARTGAGTTSKKPAGVSDAEWNAMTPEEKALWK